MSRSIVFPGFLLVMVLMMLSGAEVQALPSFARQTGMPCSACHVQAFGPGLTPTGRNFKLYGYTDVSDDRTKFIPIAGMIRGSFTHTNNSQPGGAADRFGPNNNVTIDEASIFYAGRITSKMGAFVQGTYDGVSNTGALDNTDVRFADYADVAGNRFVYGVSVNNNPTVQDRWNTTPAWAFPGLLPRSSPRLLQGCSSSLLAARLWARPYTRCGTTSCTSKEGDIPAFPGMRSKELERLIQDKTGLTAEHLTGEWRFRKIGTVITVRSVPSV
jgi:hypothetical protein